MPTGGAPSSEGMESSRTIPISRTTSFSMNTSTATMAAGAARRTRRAGPASSPTLLTNLSRNEGWQLLPERGWSKKNRSRFQTKSVTIDAVVGDIGGTRKKGDHHVVKEQGRHRHRRQQWDRSGDRSRTGPARRQYRHRLCSSSGGDRGARAAD